MKHEHQQRRALVDDIVAEARETAAYTGRREFKPATLEALAAVDRADFVEPNQTHLAYANRPLGIGHGQTISQPFIVALMTDLMDIDAESRVLEVGTGSGYQAAILGRIAARVDSLEIIPELARIAAERLSRLGYENVHVHLGNGRDGRPDDAPYDAIMVTAAADDVPPALLDQLAPGGTLVIPVNAGSLGQSLRRISKDIDGTLRQRDVLPVMFVPLTGH